MPCEIGDNVPLAARAACKGRKKATPRQERIATERLDMDVAAEALTEPERSWRIASYYLIVVNARLAQSAPISDHGRTR